MMKLGKQLSGALIILVYMVVSPQAVFAQGSPGSFADLSEELLPAVVNVYTTQNITVDRNRKGGGITPGSPLEEFFKR
ncbi:MAG: hypothetical protein P8J14_02475, partial [Emcibacteraceae bacterium]|nr:hypothetical protein [Emcibacteraceae bacterium]